MGKKSRIIKRKYGVTSNRLIDENRVLTKKNYWRCFLLGKKYSETVINAFLKYDKIVDIMTDTGLSRSTIQRYRDDPELQQLLAERKTEYIKTAVNKMQLFLCEGVETLQKIIRDDEVAPQIKINAIQIMFNQCRSWTETTDILERLKLLEDAESERSK